MLPVEEGNEECFHCIHYDIAFGCVPTYIENGFPPCGRNVIVSQEWLKKLMRKE